MPAIPYSDKLRHGSSNLYILYTGISKIDSVYGNLKDQMKVDLCICEALSCTSVPWKPYLWAWLSISIEPIFRRRQSRRQWLLTTKLATPIQLKVVYMEVSGRTSSLLQYSSKVPILDSGETLHTLQKQHQQQTYLLPESFGIL